MIARNDGTVLPHLQGPAAPVRQVIAAYAVKGLDHIVEIGGAGLPISRFLQHTPRSVTVIDPKIAALATDALDGHPCRLRHISAKLQETSVSLDHGTVGVIMIGLSLKPFGTEPAVSADLLALCRRADRVVIEYQLGLPRPEEQVPELIAKAGLAIAWSLDLTLSDSRLDGTERAARRLLVLEPKPASM